MPRDCANCGTSLIGRYCSTCGQDSSAPPASAFHFLATQTAEMLGYDSRLGRTLAALLLRPGALTGEYVTGHRVRYMAPLPVYLLMAGLFFFAHTLRPFIRFDPERNLLRSGLSAVSVFDRLTPSQLDRLNANGKSLDLFAEKFQAAATALLPGFFLGSLLLFAAALWALNRKQAFSGLIHPVFAMHWGAFYLGLGCLDRSLSILGAGGIPLAMLFSAGSLGYLVVAIRHAYLRSWLISGLQGPALLLWFYFLLAMWQLSVMALAVHLTLS